MNNNKGYSFIEFLVTLSIIVAFSSFGLPEMKSFTQNNQMRNNTNQVIMSLQYARKQAIKRNQKVSMCASDDGITCGGEWKNGWIVLAEQDNELLDYSTPLDERVKFSLDSPKIVTFSHDGTLPEPTPKQTIHLSPMNPGQLYREVSVDIAGTISSCVEPCK